MELHNVGALSWNAFLITSAIKIIVVFTFLLVIVALLTLLERWLSAWIQDRLGPNRVGPKGLLQPAADGLKNILKEETYPEEASRFYFILAPMIAIMPALITFAVIPFAAPLPTPGIGLVPMILADVPIGILYILALTSLGVYGIVLAGWSSNNKYAFLGGLRASAQMVSYEVALGMSLIPVFMLAGNVTLPEIVFQQQQGLGIWFAFPLGLAFFLFVVASFAETNRLPFDLPEAESELITGLSHRILFDEVQHVLHRRILEHADGIRAHGHAVPGRLGHPVLARRRHARQQYLAPGPSSIAASSGVVEDARSRSPMFAAQDVLLHLHGSCGCAGRCRASATTR